MNDICISHIWKSYDRKTVLHDFCAVLPAGSITCLMAPSGSGKTTLLRILMGLEPPDKGRILGLEGYKKSAVFQENRLCENLDAVKNIRLVSPALSSACITGELAAVGLSDCASQPVRELSGGMRRRVAILRALLADGNLLLMDEPFSGLDADTRERVIRYTRLRCNGRTVLFVTHDPEEARAMCAAQILTL